MSKQILLGYSHAFLSAADAHAAAATEKGVDGEVDGMMCVIALQNSAAGATKVLGKGTKAVQAFNKKASALSDVRDMLTHFDAYAVGEGRLQKPLGEEDGPFGWMPMWNSPETILILCRRRGEEIPTRYEVTIQPTLVAVAELVSAAAVALGVERSPLVKRLTQ
ncbi:hypothetical protein FNH13_09615 [Ornithinimicrobium ciconiae]|uniref:Uncharacterized protein n=1 Tax=Ornithinimicrobium ciconiae TaxID=2594265 RepID=A0A516GAL3_9MICO|nr:hypothetical protein [Ornithinimicrobium ciconiae]QDO88563.1 hypothetical protein FNH13_09615 [Ornithinimicrobium ciconiae]